MGDRGQVWMVNENVWLYTHWGAYRLVKDVQTALARKQRWDDEEYLARIIFETMVDKYAGREDGYGIGSGMHGDVWRVVAVDCDTQNIKVYRINDFSGDIKKSTVEWDGSFDEFIKADFKSDEDE